jgi:hypothetical protein
MSTHTFQFGEVRVTVEAPDDAKFSIYLYEHPRSEEAFERTVEVFGGIGEFDPVNTRQAGYTRQIERSAKSGDLRAAVGVYVPDSMEPRGHPVADPVLVKLAERRAAARGALEGPEAS